MIKNVLRTLTLASIISCTPFVHDIYRVEESPGRVEFLPNRVYELKACLKGKYVITPMNKNSYVVTYLNHNDKIYQQALFTYAGENKGFIASVVEIDFNIDGIIDMSYQRNENDMLILMNKPHYRMHYYTLEERL